LLCLAELGSLLRRTAVRSSGNRQPDRLELRTCAFHRHIDGVMEQHQRNLVAGMQAEAAKMKGNMARVESVGR
jgi:hypothetical protein